MPNLKVTDLEVFVPAKDFELSRRFYTALGCRPTWDDGAGLAEFELGGARFLLQNFYAKDWAENFMVHIEVEDADAWYRHVSQILSSGEFSPAHVQPPRDEPFGLRITYTWDPSGVLLRFSQPIPTAR